MFFNIKEPSLFNVGQSRFKKLALSVLALSLSSTSYAAAYSIFGEASGKNAGDYGAGVAAEANDASTLYFNPAGMVLLDNSELSLNGSLIHVNSKFNGNVDIDFNNVNVFSENVVDGENHAKNHIVPALYYVKKVNDRLAWGIGVFSPFGLETNWGTDNALKYSGTKTRLQIIDVSPAVSAKLTDTLSFGAAFDLQFADVEYNSIVGTGGDVPPIQDHISETKGSSVGFAAHAGMIWQVKPNTRIGINYQSQAQHQFYGSSTLEGPFAANGFDTSNSAYTDPVNFPAMTTAGFYHQASSRLGLMASASYVQWSSIKDITLHNLAILGGERSAFTAVQNLKNTWRVVGGAKYQVNDKWLVRGGIGWDQTPINDTDRDIRVPDGNRLGVAVGAHYQYSDKLGIDAGWTHLFVSGVSLNKLITLGELPVEIDITDVGNVKGSADILGAQLTWKVD